MLKVNGYSALLCIVIVFLCNTRNCSSLQGCRAPLVAKFADTQKEKEMKKLQHQFQSNASLLGMANLMGGLGSLNPQYLAVSFIYNCRVLWQIL